MQCIHRLDLQSSRCFSSRHSSRDAPRVIPPSDAPPVIMAEVDPRGCAPPHCSKKIDELSLEYLLPSLWSSSLSEELNNRHVLIVWYYLQSSSPEYSRPLSPSCYVCTTTHTSNQSLLHQSIPSVRMKFNSISIEEYESRLEVLSCDYSHDTRFLSSSTNHSSFLIYSLHSM